MKKYKIKYYFDGYGEVGIFAKSENEAEEAFLNGDWDGKENEWGENYNINKTEKI